MIKLIVRYCTIDGKPINKSRSYKMMRGLLGKDFADRFTYEAIWPPD